MTAKEHDGIAVYSACTPCARQYLPFSEESEPGRWMGIAHASHAAELVALGWVLTEYPHEPPDVVCEHYHAAYWQDGQ